MKFLSLAIFGLAQALPVASFDYEVVGLGEIFLSDQETGVLDIKTLFVDQFVNVEVLGVEWNYTGLDNGLAILNYETLVNGEVQDAGEVDLSAVERELPLSVSVGMIKVSSRGSYNIEVILTVDEASADTSREIQAFGAGVSIFPLLVVLLFSVTTRMVEFSLFSAIFVGSCMVAGNVNEGFKRTLDDFILNALADPGHGYVYLFTLFLSGLVGMMEKSGGMHGFTKTVAKYATTSRSGQLATFLIGLFIFFDDYANVLLAGETMRPLTDLLFVSREKLAFIVDATAAPIASLTPVSSWVGFEVSLIQEEIDRLILLEGPDLTIDTSGLAVFLQSIKYRYYPIFMIFLMVMIIYTKRDVGPMLVAERKTQVYNRTDGGDGKLTKEHESGDKKPNSPREDQPLEWWNMIIPVCFLIFFIFYLLIKSGEDESGEQNFIDKLQGSDSYSALLWGTMAAAIVTLIFYVIQPVKYGRIVIPTPSIAKELLLASSVEEGEDLTSHPRLLMSLREVLESFLFGMGRIFPALIVLTLAWAAGSVMISVGVNRLFSSWIVGGIKPEMLPTLSFVISAFMALATGTSWGTMAILMPLILVPTYQVSNGDTTIFYSTVAGVLSGAVAGDHVSPISDTTVLSAMACDCHLLAHVSTQAPYAIITIIISILFGTIPIGKDSWPNIVGILLGVLCLGLLVFFLFKPVLNQDGSYDIFMELWMRYKGEDSELHQLKSDTANYSPLDIVASNNKQDEDDFKAKKTEVILIKKSETISKEAQLAETGMENEPNIDEQDEVHEA